MYTYITCRISSVQPLSHVWLFATPWTATCQAFLYITNSWSLLKHMSIKSCHPTISCSVAPLSSCLQSFPASGSFPMTQFFTSGDQSIGVSASASVLPMKIQDWFPLGLTGLISLQSKGLSRVFSNTTVQKHLVWWTKWPQHLAQVALEDEGFQLSAPARLGGLSCDLGGLSFPLALPR